MISIEEKRKMLGVSENNGDKHIVVTHVTIRQSIFFLLLKLFAIEIVAALGIILFYLFVFSPNIRDSVMSDNTTSLILAVIFLVLIKLCLVIYIVVEWVDEYYEITPHEIFHKKGFLFKIEEEHKLSHLGSLTFQQGLLGRIFNYGTLQFYNWEQNKTFVMYLVHNPRKYFTILKTLLPRVDEEKEVFREHLLYKEKV